LKKSKRDIMIEENMWVVDHVIKDYRHLMQYNDLKSAGLYGLIQGIDKYKEGRGTKPSTYARHWVKAEVLKSLYENRNVHIPWNKINDYIKEKNEDDMFSSVSGTARSLSSNRRKTKSHKKMIPQFEISLDTRTNTEEATQGRSDNIELQSSLSSADLHIKEKQELKEHINFVIENSDLTPIEKTTICYRFGLEGLEPKTLSEISALTGYTAMGIQKAEKRALGKLQNHDLLKDLLL